MSAKIRRTPLRAVTGAFIISSGIDKVRAGDEHAKGLHGFASSAYPMVEKIDPKLFARGVGVVEVGLGAALLLPVVPPVAAGLGLIAFSGSLLGMYWRTPGMHRGETDPRPTQDGIAVAKDVWMLGIGTSLLADALSDGARDKRIEATHELSKAAAVNAERVRGRGRLARRLVRARVREARANARAVYAAPAAKAGRYVDTAKGMTKKVADVLT
jgi:uncharacterized membrane protein YphA (DoxX/SURF4 family)